MSASLSVTTWEAGTSGGRFGRTGPTTRFRRQYAVGTKQYVAIFEVARDVSSVTPHFNFPSCYGADIKAAELMVAENWFKIEFNSWSKRKV
jgi:hypothetical protein